MTEAQRVVDTFAPFVGTEGLRGVIGVYTSNLYEGKVCVAYTVAPSEHLHHVHPDVAHGFLLSRLAEGLAEAGWQFKPRCGRPDKSWVVFQTTLNASEIELKYPDYPSAILAAARVEWPKREPEAKGRLEILPPETINLNGVVYRREPRC